MEEIALLNPRRRVRRVSPLHRRRTRVMHVLRRNPRRKGKGSLDVPTVTSIKGLFSKNNLMNWAYLGGGFMVGVAAEKSFGERISNMFRVNVPIADTFIKQIPLIAGITLLGRGLPKSALTGMQAYVGYRLVNSALQMANINLAGVSGLGYTPNFGLSGIYEPISSAAISQMSGVSDEVFTPSF